MAVKALEAEGVTHVFGIPGGTVIPLYDALYEASFKHVLVRHEQAAAHAADGYARASGKTGVCLCTSGPGFTNILTGLATAYSDSVPMVAIAGQVATNLIGTDAFQEADAFGSSLPMVKHSYLIRELKDLPSAFKSAFELAVAGRPGPVLIDLPVDIQKAVGPFSYPQSPLLPLHLRHGEEDFSGLSAALALLQGAQRPVLLAGGGVVASAGAAAALFELAEKTRIPVATSLLGKGAFPESHPLALGMAGMHGTVAANLALSQADVVLAVGTRFSDRTTGRLSGFAQNARLIHADADASELGKNIAADVSLLGDARLILAKLEEGHPAVPERSWLGEVENWRKKYPLSQEQEARFTPAAILRRIQQRYPDACVATDVGQNQMWSALHWKSASPRTFLSSGGLGTMGYGLPAAMGAAFAMESRTAETRKPVFCFAGDGGFLMNVQELDTCARYRLPVNIFILNNGCLGMVRQWQELFWEKRYSHTTASPTCSFAALAEAFGMAGHTCESLEHLDALLDGLPGETGPVLVDCRIGQQENIYPMVPSGASLDEFLYETP